MRAGERDWFAKPMIDSYHTVWFQLHEDLLNTLGIERSKEVSALMNSPWGSVLTAMVTPFDDDGALDLDGAAEARPLAGRPRQRRSRRRRHDRRGADAQRAEKLDLWRAVSEAVTIPVVAGTGTNNTAETVELTRAARPSVGVAGVLVVGPYYNRPPQSGIEAHFRAVAAATHLPVMVYDVPGRTGRRIAHDVLVRLVQRRAEHRRVQGRDR